MNLGNEMEMKPERENFIESALRNSCFKSFQEKLLCSSAFSTYEGLPPATESKDYQVPLMAFFEVFRAAIFERNFDLTPKIL